MVTAITNATLIDGNGAEPVRGATIIVEGERIAQIGANAAVPAGADVIDAGGRTVMPGMIDCHVHMLYHPASLQERLLTPPTRATKSDNSSWR